MDIFKTKELKSAIGMYNTLEAEYRFAVNEFNRCAIRLYQQRKETLYTIAAFRNFVESLQNSEEFLSILRKAPSVDEFQRTVTQEEAGEECHAFDIKSANGAAVSAATAATGFAAALGGQTGLWALASAYGISSTGTAISTLAGVAEWNAFLAWLGGGTIAAGGGGMALGGLVFAGVPIIGWLIAAGGLAYTGWSIHKTRGKNKETLRQVYKAQKQIRIQTQKMQEWANRARNLSNSLIELRAFLNLGLFVNYPNDCEEFSKQQKDYLTTCCEYYVKLCQNINEVVAK